MWKIGMPNLGHTMEFGKVVSWLKRPGEAVATGEAIAVVETDKVTVDVEAPAAGHLLAVFAEIDKSIPVGSTIAVIGDLTETDAAQRAADAPVAEKPTVSTASAPPLHAPTTRRPAGRVPISPAARRRATELGLDVARVVGTGESGLITSADVERAAASQPASLVLLHGFAANPSLFGPLREAVDFARPTVALALPGHEGGPDLPDVADIAGLARLLSDAPVFQGNGRMVLCGHSLGAAIAVALAQAMPERVAGLVLIAPPGLGAPIDPEFIEDFLAGDSPARAQAALAKLVARPERISQAFHADTARRMSDRAHVARLRRIAESCLAATTPLGPTVASLACPVSILWGRHDRVLAPPAADAVPPRADFMLVAEAGHLLPAERPATLARHLAAFIAEHAEKSP
jgi:pimeloyl-ACP methyl ester carboxylesterase